MWATEGSPVATREGGVDRNTEWAGSCLLLAVATREGGVDRNVYAQGQVAEKAVATREGGVDRNSLMTSTA